jgi:recombination protein RecR
MAAAQIERLIQMLARLPGLGPRSGRRAVLHLLKKRETLMLPLLAALQAASEGVTVCRECGNLDGQSPCQICADPKRDATILCVVEDVSDLWALERAAAFRGRYHVLGGVLSAIEGIGPDDLNIPHLLHRAAAPDLEEVILATNATVDGQTTAHYLTDRMADLDVTVSRLAHGVPVGGELDYLDDGTLTAALRARRPF